MNSAIHNNMEDPDGQAREADGKRISQSVVDAMTAKELHAMRLGPGKHLKGRTLFDGLVKPEEVRSRGTGPNRVPNMPC